VTDVFYLKKRKNTKTQTSENEITDYGADYCEGNACYESSDGDNDDNSKVSENDDTDYEVSDNECGSEEDQSGISRDETDDLGVKLKLRRKINGILADARHLEKLFRSSTVRNSILHSIVCFLSWKKH
jgi:hypothetical protein